MYNGMKVQYPTLRSKMSHWQYMKGADSLNIFFCVDRRSGMTHFAQENVQNMTISVHKIPKRDIQVLYFLNMVRVA